MTLEGDEVRDRRERIDRCINLDSHVSNVILNHIDSGPESEAQAT